jgi:hypothetical protein
MSIQKKSLLSGLNATKKAIVASSQAKPTVNAPVSARVTPKVLGNAHARLAGPVRGRIVGRVIGHAKA